MTTTLFQCRLCLIESEFCYSLFDEDVTDIIEAYTSIKISEDDEFPSTCCSKCLQDVHTVNSICTRIVESDIVLRNSKENVTKIEVEDDDQEEVICEQKTPLNSESIIERNAKITDEEGTCANNNLIVNSGDLEDNFLEFDDDLEENSQVVTINPHINIELKKKLEMKRKGTNLKEEKEDKTVFKWRTPQLENFHCYECDIDLNNRKSYIHHITKHNNKTCKVCNIECKSIPSFIKHMDIHQSGTQICSICGSIAKNLESLRGHHFYMHRNTADQYKCEPCGRVFRYKYKYKLHLRKIHLGLRTHCCEICGKSFFTFCDLNSHKNMTHLKKRPYICEYCKKAFSSRHAMKTHVRQHTNETPFKCEVCADGFRQKVSLKAHLKSKHGICMVVQNNSKFEDNAATKDLKNLMD